MDNNSENILILSPDDFQNICRTCLSTSQLESIYTNENNFSVVNMLMAIANVHITVTDNLPPKMCCSCINTLKLAFQFKQQCEEAEFKLKELLNNYKSMSVNENSFDSKTEVIVEDITYNIESDDEKYSSSNETRDIFKNDDYINTSIDNENSNSIKVDINEKSLRKARTSKSNKKPCPICTKLIRSRHLKDHIQSMHTVEKQYHCVTCDQKFQSKCNYVRHLKIHTDERPHKCEFCDKTFRQAYGLRVHIRVHTRERPYKCKFCDKSFRQSSGLHKHKKMHGFENINDDTQYTCSICNKGFSTSLGLRSHSRIHGLEYINDDTQYTCPICNKGFSTSLGLGSHSRMHTIGSFYCNDCHKQFSSKVQLDNHIYFDHTMEKSDKG